MAQLQQSQLSENYANPAILDPTGIGAGSERVLCSSAESLRQERSQDRKLHLQLLEERHREQLRLPAAQRVFDSMGDLRRGMGPAALDNKSLKLTP